MNSNYNQYGNFNVPNWQQPAGGNPQVRGILSSFEDCLHQYEAQQKAKGERASPLLETFRSEYPHAAAMDVNQLKGALLKFIGSYQEGELDTPTYRHMQDAISNDNWQQLASGIPLTSPPRSTNQSQASTSLPQFVPPGGVHVNPHAPQIPSLTSGSVYGIDANSFKAKYLQSLPQQFHNSQQTREALRFIDKFFGGIDAMLNHKDLYDSDLADKKRFIGDLTVSFQNHLQRTYDNIHPGQGGDATILVRPVKEGLMKAFAEALSTPHLSDQTQSFPLRSSAAASSGATQVASTPWRQLKDARLSRTGIPQKEVTVASLPRNWEQVLVGEKSQSSIYGNKIALTEAQYNKLFTPQTAAASRGNLPGTISGTRTAPVGSFPAVGDTKQEGFLPDAASVQSFAASCASQGRPVNFYKVHANPVTGFMSNFSEVPVTFTNPLNPNGPPVQYRCAEAAFQAQKLQFAPNNAQNQALLQQFMNADGGKAFTLGRSIQGLDSARWDQSNEQIMRSVVHQKFAQSPQLMQLLVATGDAYLNERAVDDAVTGQALPQPRGYPWTDSQGPNGESPQNLLGRILMDERASLTGRPTPQAPANYWNKQPIPLQIPGQQPRWVQ